MGDIIGGIIGGVGSLIGGAQAAGAEKSAAKQALTGYNYLSTNAANQSAQSEVPNALGLVNNDLAQQGATQGAEQQLLTSDQQNNPAYQNYLNSTGYKFQLGQGTQAITGSAAAKGILNSGATAKALTSYGQGLAGQSFNNYLGQLGGLQAQQGQQAAGALNVAQLGTNAAQAVGAAGSTGGVAAGQQTAAAGGSTGTSIAQAGNVFGGALQNYFGGLPPPPGAAPGATSAYVGLGG